MTSTLIPPTDFPDAQTSIESQSPYGVGDQATETAHPSIDSQAEPGGLGKNFPDAQSCREDQTPYGVGESDLPQSIENPPAKWRATAAPNLHDPKLRATANHQSDHATNLPDAHSPRESQPRFGVGDQAGAETVHGAIDSQISYGSLGPILADPALAMCADVVDDLERVKIANENRLRTLTADTGAHGHGLSIEHDDMKRLAAIVDALGAAEHQAVLNLQRAIRKHPLGAFVKNSKGIGEKQAARLLASIGDPYWNDLHNRPRKLRELYRFCGMDVVGTSAQGTHDSQTYIGAGVAPSKQRGERVHWSPDARMRLWLIASKCVMVGHGGPYRAIYDEGRAKYADAIHAGECKRCGPKGKPAQPGSPLSAAHQHARAIRLIAKAILRDLWTESKDIHQQKELEQ
jgi:hypothetical protein